MSIPYQLDKESKSVACEIKRKKKNKCLTKEWSVKVKYFKTKQVDRSWSCDNQNKMAIFLKLQGHSKLRAEIKWKRFCKQKKWNLKLLICIEI